MKKYLESQGEENRIHVILEEGEPYSEEAYLLWSGLGIKEQIPCIRVWFNRQVHLIYRLDRKWRKWSDALEGMEDEELRRALRRKQEFLETMAGTGIPCENLMLEDQSLQTDSQGGLHVMCFSVRRPTGDAGLTYEPVLIRVKEEIRDTLRGLLSQGFLLRSLDTPVPVEFVVRHEEFIIGKGIQGIDGTVPEAVTVSRRHLAAGIRGGAAYVRDLGSTNGTVLNGNPLPAETEEEIVPGDIVGLAEYSFVVEPLWPEERGTV